MAMALSGCVVNGPYSNHGYPLCFLMVGPEYPNVETPVTAFPILGDVLWEACTNHGPF